jgi:ABC-type siderophore export system fused ATPase/permease subunit
MGNLKYLIWLSPLLMVLVVVAGVVAIVTSPLLFTGWVIQHFSKVKKQKEKIKELKSAPTKKKSIEQLISSFGM